MLVTCPGCGQMHECPNEGTAKAVNPAAANVLPVAFGLNLTGASAGPPPTALFTVRC